MRRITRNDIRARAFALLFIAVACASYIVYRFATGQATLVAWLPLIVCAAGALHYFRQSRG